MSINQFAVLGFSEPSSILLAVLLILVAVFEIYMFIHVIQNKSLTTNRKLLWVIGMILIHPFVAIVYYFTDYKKG